MNTASNPANAVMPSWERAIVYAMVAASLVFSLLPTNFRWDYDTSAEISADGSLIVQLQWGTLFLVSGLLLLRRNDTFMARVRELNPFLILLVIYCFASVLWSPLPVTALKRSIQLVGLTMLAIAVHDRLSHRMDFRRLIGVTMLIIMVLSMIVSVLAPRIGVDYLLGGAWRGITQHKNTLGMVAAIVVLLWVSGFTRMHLPIKVRAVGLALSFFILVMAKSSTALLTAVLGVAILVLLKKRVPRRNHLFSRIALIVSIIVVLGLHTFYVVMGRLPTWEEMFSIVGALTGKSSDLTGRNVIWALVIQETANHPIFGIGYGSFWAGPGSPSDAVTRHLEGWHNIYQAHNGYLDLINELGFVGLGLFVGMIVTHLLTLARLAPFDRDQALLHVTLLLFLLLSNFSESGLMRGVIAQNLLFIYLSVDASMSLARYRRAQRQAPGLSRTGLADHLRPAGVVT